MKKKIVYVVGGLYRLDGMSKVLSMKANYLAEHSSYEVHVILTEKADVPFQYSMSPLLHIVNFDLNFDDLDTMPLYKKIWYYNKKQRKYKKLFSNYLMEIRPAITVSAMRREINFLTSIPDGSKKIGEIHFNKTNYRQFQKRYFPSFINRTISHIWMNRLIKVINNLDRFIVLSKEDKAKWSEIKNIQVIYNPLSTLPNKTSDCSSHKVIAVGRYTWQKGFDMLINAWSIVAKQYPDWELYIYGSGDNSSFQQNILQKELNNSLFCCKSTEYIYEKYLESSIFVLSSRYEGFGMVITEAMSCGLPPVSFACPCGPKDIITDGKDGLLVEPENIVQLADRICFLIKNEKLRKEMGYNARLNIERFKLENIMQQWIDLFDSSIK